MYSPLSGMKKTASFSGFSKLWRKIVGEPCQDKTTVMKPNGEIMPFGVYAACRLLHTTEAEAQDSDMFEAIRTLSCMYMRADLEGFTDCITAFELDTLLLEATSQYKVFNTSTKGGSRKKLSCRNLVVDMANMLEALMQEYLGCHWDKIEMVFAANSPDLLEDGMSCSRNYGSVKSLVAAPCEPVKEVSRAIANWKRAYKVAIKQVALNALGTQRKFRTFVQMAMELKREPAHLSFNSESGRNSPRGPILLLLGGGMAAGKSTVREIIGSDQFWSKVCKDAVIVEADAIKSEDVVFQVLSGRLNNDPSVSSLVHGYSTAAAESMLVAAVNDQQDIVFDGTMTWFPFVEQTIAMVRDYRHRYVRGPGCVCNKDGVWEEDYWKQEAPYSEEEMIERLPYRIELIGVTCDPAIAVARGFWRKLRSGRGVPVSSQLRSHRLFSENFEKIANLVDSATLYHTGNKVTNFTKVEDTGPKVIAHSSKVTRGEMLVNPRMWNEFQNVQKLCDTATCHTTLYDACPSPLLDRQFSSDLNQIMSGTELREKLKAAHQRGRAAVIPEVE